MPLLSSIKTQVSSGGGTAGAGASLLLLLGLGWAGYRYLKLITQLSQFCNIFIFCH